MRLTAAQRLDIIMRAIENADAVVLHKGDRKATLGHDMHVALVSALRLALVRLLEGDVANNP